ncbi:TSCPD domain-containing protein [Pseudohaliea rubra]|uniref:ribonucleoside-diphosphate reductase n=1 Tax=Pseudohaliea rubra DSM 19751 TaxID=1265313 RepID=A0A095VUX1_9GAMM|nr:NrdJb [Pseudohaliea rubra]KGE04868.1 Ribonucleotide reductase of class II (coenzyme B12-dependent), alpha subunit [Pseudohaliea rubra DSM 19751]
MTTRIDKKIVSYKVRETQDEQQPAEATAEAAQPESNVVQMHEAFVRPERLVGSTYKIKTPLSEHAMYITVNDVILNEGTEHESRRPFEVFINSKNMEHFQWVVALTRLISAIFRKGGDATFLVEELKAVFDPRGGYFKKGGVFMPSIVAEIGYAIEDHMKHIGLINSDLDQHQQQYLEKKRQELADGANDAKKTEGAEAQDNPFPPSASLCMKCHTKAVVLMDGCMTCLNCADSKCG